MWHFSVEIGNHFQIEIVDRDWEVCHRDQSAAFRHRAANPIFSNKYLAFFLCFCVFFCSFFMSVSSPAVSSGVSSLLPQTSLALYTKTFDTFQQWFQESYNLPLDTLPEPEVFLKYFQMLRNQKHYAPKTLWQRYSMINTLVRLRWNTSLQTHASLVTYYLKQAEKENPIPTKKAEIFTSEEMNRFLVDAPDDPKHLWLKTVMVLGIYGGLRAVSELRNLQCELVKPVSDGYHVSFPPAKSGFVLPKEAFFLVPRSDSTPSPAGILELYKSRVKDWSGQLLKNWNVKGGKYVQNSGPNPISKAGVEIAKWLKLPNPNSYTSHTFRRSAATFAADNGASLVDLKRHFRWKSDTVALGYLDGSVLIKRKAADFIAGEQEERQPKLQKLEKPQLQHSSEPRSGVQIGTIMNCNVVVNNYITPEK